MVAQDSYRKDIVAGGLGDVVSQREYYQLFTITNGLNLPLSIMQNMTDECAISVTNQPIFAT